MLIYIAYSFLLKCDTASEIFIIIFISWFSDFFQGNRNENLTKSSKNQNIY